VRCGELEPRGSSTASAWTPGHSTALCELLWGRRWTKAASVFPSPIAARRRTSGSAILGVAVRVHFTSRQADGIYTATADDESGVCVSGPGATLTLTLTNPTIVTSGKSLDTDYSSFYGLNAGALAYTGGALSIAGGTISTSGQGANGVFVYGPGASAVIKDVTIIATANNGHGLEVAGGGALAIENVTATSSGASSSVVATDRGDGNRVTVTGGAYTANGFRSAAVYSTGAMTLSDATLTANAAEGALHPTRRPARAGRPEKLSNVSTTSHFWNEHLFRLPPGSLPNAATVQAMLLPTPTCLTTHLPLRPKATQPVPRVTLQVPPASVHLLKPLG
jgi:hypothetical protein